MSLYAHPLPGRCQGCGTDVFWNGKYWRPAGKGASRHKCPQAACGAWMVQAREHCARRPGHGMDRGYSGHRTAYAIENDRVMRSGRTWDNTGASDGRESNTLRADARPSAITRSAGVVASIEVMAR